MSFDIHGALRAVKLYGILLACLFVPTVLQPQKLVALLVAGDGAFAGWAAHIGTDLWLNLLAAVIVTAIAYYLDLLDVRRATGAGSRDLGGRR